MKCPDHRDYYLTRAATSRDLAEHAANPKVAAIHAEFAVRYDEMASRSDRENGVCGRGSSGGATQPTMKVILIEAGNLDQLCRVQDHDAAPLQRHRP